MTSADGRRADTDVGDAAVGDALNRPVSVGSGQSVRRLPRYALVGTALVAATCGLAWAEPTQAGVIASVLPIGGAWLVLAAGVRRGLATGAACVVVAIVMALAAGAGAVPALAVAAAVAIAGPLLGWVHATALQTDVEPAPDALAADAPPADATAHLASDTPTFDWPAPPTLRHGATPVLAAWGAATAAALTVAWAAAGIGALRTGLEAAVDFIYVNEACASGTTLAGSSACKALDDQRDAALGIVEQHPAAVAGLLAAIAAVAMAASTHWFVGRLAASHRLPVRRVPRLSAIEVHWVWSYIATAGIALVALAATTAPLGPFTTGLGVYLVTVGALVVAGEGLALAAWGITRPSTPGWYRVLVVLLALLYPEVALGALVALGMLELAVHTRRRRSGTIHRRGDAR